MIADLERTMTLRSMVAYAGATWDWHHMHYDRDYVREAGLPGPVVDGQMLGALMASQLVGHYGPGAFLRELSFRFTSTVFAGEVVRVEAEEAERGEGTVRVTQRVTVGDRVAAEGEAVVRL